MSYFNRVRVIGYSSFFKISKTSFISDCINLFRYRWSEYYDKNKQIINVYEFLNSLGLNDLLFYTNNFDEYIQNEFMKLKQLYLNSKIKNEENSKNLSEMEEIKNKFHEQHLIISNYQKNNEEL